MGGKIIPRIRLASAKVVVEVETELGNFLWTNNFLDQILFGPETFLYLRFFQTQIFFGSNFF